MSIDKNKLCYNVYSKCNKNCDKNSCPYNNSKVKNNCLLIQSKKKHTLQEVGDFLEITRMRVCQIEKNIIKKILSSLGKD